MLPLLPRWLSRTLRHFIISLMLLPLRFTRAAFFDAFADALMRC